MAEESPDFDVTELTPPVAYNITEARLVASTSWLVSKVFGKNIPDALMNPCYVEERGNVRLKPSTIYSLSSGELYCGAAANIFRDSGFLNQNHSAILHALKRIGLKVQDQDGTDVTETVLTQTAPFKENAHLAVMDALMLASIRESISVEKIVDSIRKYANIHPKEFLPANIEEALLFWINKICMLMREKLKNKGYSSSFNVVVPEMGDVYEDICDGASLATLLAFYNCSEMKVQGICYNEQMSVADGLHNLRLIKRFCRRVFETNIFHFGKYEDLLYTHEGLRPNILVFLTDLFCKMEGVSDAPSSANSKSKRHFSRTEIPDLRPLDKESFRSPTNRPSKLFQQTSGVGQRENNSLTNNTSLMNSADSLMTQQSCDSLKYHSGGTTPVKSSRDMSSPNATTFADFLVKNTPDKSLAPDLQENVKQNGHDRTPSWSVRMQLDEKRKQIEAQKSIEKVERQQQKQQLSKEAFLKLHGKQQLQQQQHVVDKAGTQRPDRRPLSAISSAGSETDTATTMSTSLDAVTVVAAASSAAPRYQQQQLFLQDAKENNSQRRQQWSDPDLSKAAAMDEISQSIREIKEQMRRLAEEQEQIQMRLASSSQSCGDSLSVVMSPPQLHQHYQHQQQHQSPFVPSYWTDQVYYPSEFSFSSAPVNVTPALGLATSSRITSVTTTTTTAVTSSVYIPPTPAVILSDTFRMPASSSTDSLKVVVGSSSLLPFASADEQPACDKRPVSPGRVGYIIGEEREEEEISKRRDLVVASALKRKSMLEKKFDSIEMDSARKMEETLQREDYEKQRKRERELHRLKVFEQYQKRKAEKEAVSDQSRTFLIHSSTTKLNSTFNVPKQPGVRPASQIIGQNENNSAANKLMTSSVDNIDQTDNRSHSSDSFDSNLISMVSEPSLKLFVKPSQKSNRNLIFNALERSIFAGQVNKDKKLKCLEELAKSDSKHFLILFRDQKCQFRAVYCWDQVSTNVHKLNGLGPTVCSEQMLQLLFKYDSGAKLFNEIPARHFSANTDGFTIREEFWQKKKPLYAKSSTMK